MFVDYGQAVGKSERHAAARIAAHYRSTHREVKLGGSTKKQAGVIRGRNALLLLTALAEWQSSSGTIALGIHAGTHYADCSATFISAMQRIFDLYSEGSLIAAAPFLKWSKRDMWEYCQTNGVPVHLTFSCEAREKTPCGQCKSCRDRAALYAL